jgi:hypothetical protein
MECALSFSVPGEDVKTVANEVKAIDITNVPELLRLAEEVRTTGEPRLLRLNGEDLAIVRPTRKRARRSPSKADYEAFLSSAGSWKDVDTDEFVAAVYESRSRSSRPPVEL